MNELNVDKANQIHMTSSAVYQRKLALIIGINDYPDDSLKYCVNDAVDLSAALERIDFHITLKLNCDYDEFIHAIDRFVETVQKDDLILFYFAGHGKEMDEQNYLLPADYEYDHREHERDYIVGHGINVQYITKKIHKKKCRITIYIFDCCRHLVKTRAMNMNQGLSPMHAPSQTLIVFACAPGKAVLDETRNNRNGSFIENLLRYIEQSDRDIEDIMKKVAYDVNIHTKGVQLPYRTSSFTEDVYLMVNSSQGVSSFTVPTNRDMCSDESIRCSGRACRNCRRCRDWYWRLVDGKMRHTKRSDAVCVLGALDYYDNDGNYYDSDFHTVCFCNDNRL